MRFLLAASLALVLAGAPSAVRAAVVDATPGGFTVENSRVVPVDAAQAYRALVDQVDAWWPKDHSWWGKHAKFSIDARAGGCFCEIGAERQARHMEVVFVDPPNLLRMTGGLGPLQGMGLGGVLEFRFAPAEGGTQITMWYRAGGYAPEDLSTLAPVVDRVQALQLGGLAALLGAKDAEARP